MFTGIIQNTGIVKEISKDDNLLTLEIDGLNSKIGDSISIDGVCLTLSGINKNEYSFQLSEETLVKTIISNYHLDNIVNVEISSTIETLFGGHIVLGHVDDIAKCNSIENVKDDLWNYYFIIDKGHLVVDKGSISINGISLTTNKMSDSEIYISVINHTYQETNLQHMKINDEVNIEYDIIGKYIYGQK